MSDPRAAGAIVDGFAVIGPESGIQATIDASQDTALGDSDDFEAATDELDEDRLATIYVAPGAALDALVEGDEIDAAERARIAERLGAAGEGPFAASLGATPDTLFAEAVSRSD